MKKTKGMAALPPTVKFILLSGLACFGVVCCVGRLNALPQEEDLSLELPAMAAPSERIGPVGPYVDRSNFIGARGCLSCHRTEYVAWMRSLHYDDGRLDDIAARDKYLNEYAALTESTPAAAIVRCQACHTAPVETNVGRTHEVSGVSCEACHGASGGEDGWLNRHAVYGPNLTRLGQETLQHYSDRVAFCDNAGMIRSSRAYASAKMCNACHIVGDAKLIEAGHPAGSSNFSLPAWNQGVIRHNFHMNQHHNAIIPSLISVRNAKVTEQDRAVIMVIVGPLAKMEVYLRNLANVMPAEGTLDESSDELPEAAEGWQSGFNDLLGLLIEMQGVADDAEDAPEGDVSIEVMEQIMAVLEGFVEDEELKVELTAAQLREAADQIEQFGNNFVLKHDGSKLGVLAAEFATDIEPGPAGKKAFEP